MLGKIPYEDVPRQKVNLSKRLVTPDHKQTGYPLKFIPEVLRKLANKIFLIRTDQPPRGDNG
jgi:hypothetical protein